MAEKTTFPVPREQSIDEFLRGRPPDYPGYPQFKVKILLDCKAVGVKRNDARVDLKSGDRVKPGEIVSIWAFRCGDSLKVISPEKYRDYAFVPPPSDPRDTYLANARQTLGLRPQTVVLENRATLSSFLDLRRSDLQDPIRDLIIVSHGNAQGELELPIDTVDTKVLLYEDLEKLAQAGSLKIEGALATPRPLDAQKRDLPLTVRFRGCLIGALPRALEGKRGAQPPHLVLLKKAMGDVRIVAPKFIHNAWVITKGPPGAIEFLRYGFGLDRPQHVASLPELTRAFAAAGDAGRFTYFDGSRIPKAKWAYWLRPQDPKVRGLRTPRRNVAYEEVALQPIVMPSILPGPPAALPARLVYFDQVLFEHWQSVALEEEPAGDVGKKAKVKEAIAKLPDFSESHAFPWHWRLGYRTLDEFMDGMRWEFMWDPAVPPNSVPAGTKVRGELAYRARRVLYTLEVPIANPPKDEGTLVGNFYPQQPADPQRQADPRPKFIGLEENDSDFFTTV